MAANPNIANLVILTGAGISAESDIRTFRDANGLWESYRIEDVASPAAFQRDPGLVHRFYNLRRAQLKTVQPNAAHLALADLERRWPAPFLLITQNVDDLHERAGSQSLIHMHGEILKLRCEACKFSHRHEEDASEALLCAGCGVTGKMRPDIVWFGEEPMGMQTCYEAMARAEIFIAIGTSGQVYPAASFVSMCRRNGRGCRTIEVNPAPTGNRDFLEVLNGRATEAVPALVEALLA